MFSNHICSFLIRLVMGRQWYCLKMPKPYPTNWFPLISVHLVRLGHLSQVETFAPICWAFAFNVPKVNFFLNLSRSRHLKTVLWTCKTFPRLATFGHDMRLSPPFFLIIRGFPRDQKKTTSTVHAPCAINKRDFHQKRRSGNFSSVRSANLPDLLTRILNGSHALPTAAEP